MKPLSGVDGAFLHLETPATPMHVASLSLFDLPPGYRGDFFSRIKRQMASRLRAAPIFQRKLAPMPLQFANPVWVHDDAVDLDRHVQRLTLPPPAARQRSWTIWSPGCIQTCWTAAGHSGACLSSTGCKVANGPATSRFTTPCWTARPARCWRRRCLT